jgi:hypothetical protein
MKSEWDPMGGDITQASTLGKNPAQTNMAASSVTTGYARDLAEAGHGPGSDPALFRHKKANMAGNAPLPTPSFEKSQGVTPRAIQRADMPKTRMVV